MDCSSKRICICSLLFELFHLLFVHHQLFVRVAEHQADISRHGSQSKHFAATIQIAGGANAARAVGPRRRR